MKIIEAAKPTSINELQNEIKVFLLRNNSAFNIQPILCSIVATAEEEQSSVCFDQHSG